MQESNATPPPAEPPKVSTGVLHPPEVNEQKAPDHKLSDTSPSSSATLLNDHLPKVLTDVGDIATVQIKTGPLNEVLTVVKTDDVTPPQPTTNHSTEEYHEE